MKSVPAVLALLAVMLTACSELQYYTGIRPATDLSEGCSVNRLMTELHDTRSMNKDELQQTLRTWEQEFQAEPSEDHRLRLALLYAAGDESVRDPGRAQVLLTEAADAFNNPADRELAAMLRQFLDEQIVANRKINDFNNPGDRELAAMLRQFLDEQIVANRKINDLNKQTAEQIKRIAELEQQQRALMNIEQKIQQRDNPAGVGNDD